MKYRQVCNRRVKDRKQTGNPLKDQMGGVEGLVYKNSRRRRLIFSSVPKKESRNRKDRCACRERVREQTLERETEFKLHKQQEKNRIGSRAASITTCWPNCCHKSKATDICRTRPWPLPSFFPSHSSSTCE
jgi:hypothetical protein